VIPAALIRAKRDGKELSAPDLEDFVRGFLEETVTPYQMSAFLMAIFFRGMSAEETAALTRVMVETGDTLDLSAVGGAKVDKHSTGGVGDLVSIPLAPLVAACGVKVPMISGRGLGHTGGTLDKLESIPGFRTDLDAGTFVRILAEVGCVMGGQTDSLAPADRRMYALRDVTATVESIPLIVSSILCKKIAEGIDALVLDVKCGRGAFMKTEGDALVLARELTRVGSLMGKQVVAFVTDMDAPLGTAVGAAPEMRVALECLSGRGPRDLMTLVYTLGAAMLCLGEAATEWDEAVGKLEHAVEGGAGRDVFRKLVELQGGDARVVDDPDRLPGASAEVAVSAPGAGFVIDLDPYALGDAAVELGGGRRRTGDEIDPGVGIVLHKRRGDRVEEGETLALVLARDEARGRTVGEERVLPAYRIGERQEAARPLVRWIVTPTGEREWAGARTWNEVRAR